MTAIETLFTKTGLDCKALPLNGANLRFKRRRYGESTTYTWVKYYTGDKWLDLGDPWPCLNPTRAEIRESIAVAMLYPLNLGDSSGLAKPADPISVPLIHQATS